VSFIVLLETGWQPLTREPPLELSEERLGVLPSILSPKG
jgi:hypothetical protein